MPKPAEHVSPEFRAFKASTMNPSILFGITVAWAVTQFGQGPHDLDVVELFSGVESIVRAGRRQGLSCMPYDKYRLPGITDISEDLTTQQGFLHAVRLVCRLRPGGLLWLAPVCSSWVFWNVSRTKRCKRNGFAGNAEYEPVKLGNLMAEACAFLIELAVHRGVEVGVENPPGSWIWKFLPFSQTVNSLCKHVCERTQRCGFDDKPKGKRLLKEYKFKATGAWVEGLAATCPCGSCLHRRLSKKWQGADGRARSQGNKAELTESAGYPRRLGEAIIRGYLAVRRNKAGASKVQIDHASSTQKKSSAAAWMQPAVTQQPGLSTHRTAVTAQGVKRKASPEWSWMQPAVCTKVQGVQVLSP